MPASTPFYGLSYFLFGDDLEDTISVDAERNRFVFIDRQIYGLYNIFGDGVISGWNVVQNAEDDKFIAIIESGYGFVDGQFAQTTNNRYIENLQPNNLYYVTASKDQNRDETNRDVLFHVDTFLRPTTVFLGLIYVGPEGITSIDTSDKTVISFLQFIKDEIANHKHRGQPSKIDLQTEVKNQLSGARIKDIDASKIVSGRFDADRIPQLNHNDLVGNGLLSHAALDSFARIVTTGNQQLLGEIASVNTIKLITAQHYYAHDMNVENGNVVEYQNLLLCIPCVTNNSVIDFEASTAQINLDSRCLSGKDVKQGSVNSIFYENNEAFFSAVERSFVTIAKNTVELVRGGSTAQEIETFKTVNNVPNYTVETEIIRNTVVIDADGRQTSEIVIRVKYVRTLTIINNWTEFDEILIDVKSLSANHGAVYIHFINGVGNDAVQSSDFILLGINEITDSPDASIYGYVRKVLNISQIVRNNIQKIVIYTDDTTTGQIFWIGSIFLRSSTLYPQFGVLKFRHSSAAPVVFNSIIYDADIPSNCDLRVRAKVANSAALLQRSEYTLALNSGDVFGLVGTDIEIEVVLIASTDRKDTPTFKGMQLQYIIDAVDSGFNIQTATEWNRGSYIGTSIAPDPISTGITNLKLIEPLSVGDYYYLYENGVNQIAEDGTAKVGFRGLTLRNFLSPKQCIDIVYDSYVAGFNNAKSVYRLINKNYIVADTANDRILEIDANGEFVRGFGSHTETDQNGFYPLNASFNPRNGILSLCFSQAVNLENFQINKIKLWIANSFIFLSDFDTIVQSEKPATILEIQLSNEKIEQITQNETECFVEFTTGLFIEPFFFVGKARRLLSNRGLRLFVGDFIYTTAINKPIYANYNKNGNIYVCNSKINAKEATNVSPTTIIVTVGSTVTKKAQALPPQDPIVFLNWDTQIPSVISSVVSTATQTEPLDPLMLEITIANPTEDMIGTHVITIKANYSNGSTEPIKMNVIVVAVTETEPQTTDYPSVAELDINTANLLFSYNDIYFSEFTLGSVYEIDENTLLISGLVQINEQDAPTEVDDPTETYEQQAIRKLSNSMGKTIIINRANNIMFFEYESPENLYPSDATIDRKGRIVIAESSYHANAGRVIKIDDSNNIVWQIGYGSFNRIFDVRSKFNSDLIIST
jgi:hypothetical protein